MKGEWYWTYDATARSKTDGVYKVRDTGSAYDLRKREEGKYFATKAEASVKWRDARDHYLFQMEREYRRTRMEYERKAKAEERKAETARRHEELRAKVFLEFTEEFTKAHNLCLQ